MAIEPGQQFSHRGSHQPSAEGPRLHDLLENGYYPKDVYETLHHYHGSDATRRLIRQHRGNPNAMVTIYRAAPKDASRLQDLIPKLQEVKEDHDNFLKTGKVPEWWVNTSPDEYHSFLKRNLSDLKDAVASTKSEPVTGINHSDWVTLDRSYAEGHAEGREGYQVLSMNVPASHIRNDGNDLNEWGYFPPKEDN
jgi:hypothetical protein